MRLRSSILVACMLVVPGLAMFSHKVPAGARRQLRQGLWEPLGAALADALGLGGGMAEAMPRPTPPVEPAMPALTGQPTPTEPPAAAVIEPIFAPPAPASVPPLGERGADRATLEATLLACGATDVEWGPDGGAEGLHRCSCRMPAEPTGQLQRVFQASGPDAIAALEALVDQVTAWSSRHGAAPAPGAAPRRTR